jgi:hypothetical protein
MPLIKEKFQGGFRYTILGGDLKYSSKKNKDIRDFQPKKCLPKENLFLKENVRTTEF